MPEPGRGRKPMGPTQTSTMQGIKGAKKEHSCAKYQAMYEKCKTDACRKNANRLLTDCQSLK